ncbi:hypothetical protein [Reyranella sp.]|jgi:hypothetical protein|uniref:hypothetical protein n=1 Tax=Reyranella sp. TaxID=1929291 RepID=UPI0011F7E532|nr:hypothetical protein [Reyranella sp.]TAJ84527.1 MAG: hypothetical protein EPO50_17705 [Reyranella sp.]
MRRKWRDRPRTERWGIIGAFLGMIPAIFAVFEFAYNGTTLDRYLIMAAGFLGGFGIGILLAKLTTPKQPS